MVLDKKIQDILEKNEFNFDEEISEQDNGKYIEINQSTPEGEDWWETIWFDGTYEGFVNAVEKRVLNFDVDEEVEIWITNRGKGGCPDSIIDLVHDAEWKQKTLENLLDDLQENKKEEKDLLRMNYMIFSMTKWKLVMHLKLKELVVILICMSQETTELLLIV